MKIDVFTRHGIDHIDAHVIEVSKGCSLWIKTENDTTLAVYHPDHWYKVVKEGELLDG